MSGRYQVLHQATVAGWADPGEQEVRTSMPPRDAFRDEFVAQFDANFQRVRRFIGRLSGDFELADDIAQDAFVRLYRRGTLPDAPGQWLVTVALNLLRNSATSRRRRRQLLTVTRAEAVHSDPAPAPDHGSGTLDSRMRVRTAMGRMPEREQRMLLMRAEGYSYREIARMLDLSEGSVGTLLARAKRLFLDAYGDASDAH